MDYYTGHFATPKEMETIKALGMVAHLTPKVSIAGLHLATTAQIHVRREVTRCAIARGLPEPPAETSYGIDYLTGQFIADASWPRIPPEE